MMERVDYPDTIEFAESGETRRIWTRKHKRIFYLISTVLALIALIVIIIVTISKNTHHPVANSEAESYPTKPYVPRPTPTPTPETCTTYQCQKTAARMSRYIDKTVDPCDDFYDFSCGKWINDNVVTDTQPEIGSFVDLREEINIHLRGLLEGAINASDVPTFASARQLYQSCFTYFETLTSSKPFLSQMFTLMPVSFISKSWPPRSLEEYIGELSSYAQHNHLIGISVKLDDHNTSNYLLQIAQPKVIVNEEMYTNPIVLGVYKIILFKILTQLYKDFSVPKTYFEINEMVKKLIELEAYISRNSQSPANVTIQNVKYLIENAPMINWTQLFISYYGGSRMSVNNLTRVAIQTPQYLRHAEFVARNYTLEDFGIFQAVSIVLRFIKFLPESYRSIFHSKDPPIWKTCLAFVQEELPDPIDRVFVQKYFDSKSKEEASEMVEHMRQAFLTLLETNKWMDAATKLVAREKALAMKKNVGYPEYIMDDSILEERMKPYTMKSSNFSWNVYNMIKNRYILRAKQIQKPVDKSIWITRIPVVNAFYQPDYNEIYIPAGILQKPIFNNNNPKYVNYGMIGQIIGHEITHGFDNTGRLRDKAGTLRPWWSSQAVANFKRHAQCFIYQYDRFVVPHLVEDFFLPVHVNGTLTLGENIADNGGIKQAFEAYNTWKRKYGIEKRLPGLPYSPEQLFFISFAQSRCQMRTDSLTKKLLNDEHAPEKFRVIGTVSNSEDFAKAFNCPRYSEMNRYNKCVLW